MNFERLDHVVWNALSTRQRGLAEGGGAALRYVPAAAPFAATVDHSDKSFCALGGMLGPTDRAALVTTMALDLPERFTIAFHDTVEQMVLDGDVEAADATALVPLQTGDVPSMIALTQATKSGPFGPRTIEMGAYLGMKSGGRLIAMAGERMRLDGFTEVSAVCVDPLFRGRGLAADLVRAVSGVILARGETPFLHVFSGNGAAIALYRKLGFVSRRQMHLTALTLAPVSG